jgi:hypothetical protein
MSEPLLDELLLHEIETTAHRTQHGAGGHSQIFEEQLGGVLGFHAQLLQIATTLEAGKLGVH